MKRDVIRIKVIIDNTVYIFTFIPCISKKKTFESCKPCKPEYILMAIRIWDCYQTKISSDVIWKYCITLCNHQAIIVIGKYCKIQQHIERSDTKHSFENIWEKVVVTISKVLLICFWKFSKGRSSSCVCVYVCHYSLLYQGSLPIEKKSRFQT